MRLLLSLYLLSFFVISAEAKLFQNSYLSFEIPGAWECKSFGTDWVCHGTYQEKKIEALITSTAKIVGPLDTLDQYLNHLQQPKTWFNSKKEQIISEKLSAKKVFIRKFPWIDSIHKNSEVNSYITRYAATVCCEGGSSKLGILVVLSAHEDYYTKYSSDFKTTVNSLRVLDIEKAIPKIRAAQATGMNEGSSYYLDELFEGGGSENWTKTSKNKILGLKPLQFLILLVVILGVGLFYFFRKKKKKTRRRR